MEFARDAYRTATSKTAQRALLNTVLLVTSSVVLYGFAATAYILFYRNYLPNQVTTIPIHLQYGYELHPFGTASLADKNVKALQEYDITVTLSLPRSPTNLERGNFMLALYLLDGSPLSYLTAATAATTPKPGATAGPGLLASGPRASEHFDGRTVLHAAFRPALMPYTDPLVSLASRLLFLAYHVFFPASETTTLAVPMVERLQFPRRGPNSGSALPSSLFLELQAGQNLQVYSASVTLTAQLRGLRWLMYQHRIVSFVVFTTLFWMCEVLSMALAWVALSVALGGPPEEDRGGRDLVKREPSRRARTTPVKNPDSDVPETYPTYGSQPPLKYEPRIKEESVERDDDVPMDLPAPGGEADDEGDEDEEGERQEGGGGGDDDGDPGRWRDSGIGTGYSDRGEGSSLTRRTSQGGSHPDGEL